MAIQSVFGDTLARKLRAWLTSTSNGLGASLLGIEDADARITAATVEAALAELAARVVASSTSETTIKAIPAAARANGSIVVDLTNDVLWVFDSGSSASASSWVLVPDAGSGRWLRKDPSLADLAATTSGNGASLIGIQDAGGYTAAATVEAALADLYLRKRTHHVRGVVTANVADLAAFTVAGNDGLTYAEGERVLLVGQTTAAQCGIYAVGAVGGGTAALTRAADFAAALPIVNGEIVEVSEGTIWAGSTWKAMCTGAKVVATDDPLFYPRVCKAVVTLVAGTKTLGSAEGIALFSTTKSMVHATHNTPNTVTATIGLYAPVASRTAGKVGTGEVVVSALKADATTDAANVSTVDVTVVNW